MMLQVQTSDPQTIYKVVPPPVISWFIHHSKSRYIYHKHPMNLTIVIKVINQFSDSELGHHLAPCCPTSISVHQVHPVKCTPSECRTVEHQKVHKPRQRMSKPWQKSKRRPGDIFGQWLSRAMENSCMVTFIIYIYISNQTLQVPINRLFHPIILVLLQFLVGQEGLGIMCTRACGWPCSTLCRAGPFFCAEKAAMT